MKTSQLLMASMPFICHLGVAQADPIHYQVEVVYIDDTVFKGSFDYDATTQQVANLQGLLDDTLMGNIELIQHQLKVENDGKGGLTVYAYAMNTTAIETNPPINNNVMAAINFNAVDPTLGFTDIDQLAYMDCSPGGLMGQTCMYHLSWHNPVFPMEGGRGIISETITVAGGQISRSDCLLNWAENTYPQLFAPVRAVSQTLPPYYFRHYSTTNAYLGISSSDTHVYYLNAEGNLLDVGHLSQLLSLAGC